MLEDYKHYQWPCMSFFEGHGLEKPLSELTDLYAQVDRLYLEGFGARQGGRRASVLRGALSPGTRVGAPERLWYGDFRSPC